MRFRIRAQRLLGVCVLSSLILGAAPAAYADSKVELSADLNGVPILLANVSRYYCHDLDYPRIHCFRTSAAMLAAPTLHTTAAAAAVVYITIYDGASWSGPFMNISENYDILALIGWNDRVSSFRAKNSLTGSFYTDWFHLGTVYTFCCNQGVTVLGGFDNSFSSLYRT